MKIVDYKKVGCGKNVYHTAQWLGGKLQCANCGIELSANNLSILSLILSLNKSYVFIFCDGLL